MAAKLPYFPEGSQALTLAANWTPIIQERKRLWDKNCVIDDHYPKMASINGGRQRKKISLTFGQKQVMASTFSAMFRNFEKVIHKSIKYINSKFTDCQWSKDSDWRRNIGRASNIPI